MDTIRAQYAANAAGLRALLARAERTGRPVNGYTASQLRAALARYEALSASSDAALRTRLSRDRIAAIVAARLRR